MARWAVGKITEGKKTKRQPRGPVLSRSQSGRWGRRKQRDGGPVLLSGEHQAVGPGPPWDTTARRDGQMGAPLGRGRAGAPPPKPALAGEGMEGLQNLSRSPVGDRYVTEHDRTVASGPAEVEPLWVGVKSPQAQG